MGGPPRALVLQIVKGRSVIRVLYLLADIHSAISAYFEIMAAGLEDRDETVSIREGEPCSQQC